MFLTRLADYGRRLADEDDDARLPPMYQRVPVRYVIKLDRDGRLQGMVDTKTPEEKRGVVRAVPNRKRSSGVRPKLLADNAEYTLGIAQDATKSDRVPLLHEAYRGLVGACAQATGDPDLAAVQRYLSAIDVGQLECGDHFDPAATIIFEVDGRRPTDLPSVQAYWASHAREADAAADGMECLVCGQVAPCPEMLPVSITGIPGGQATGTQLVSANSDVFESYGLRRAQTSPVCQDCGLLACNALNRLLADEDTHLASGELAYVFWTREPVRLGWSTLLSRAVPDEVRGLLRSPWSGKPGAAALEPAPFYAAALSANSARVVVRDWIETTLGEARRHLQRYFRMQRLLGRDGTEQYFPLRQLGRATVNAKSRQEKPPAQVGQALAHVALHGGPLPEWLLFQAVRRARAEQGVTAAQAALIKMVLLTQQIEGVENVNETNDLARLDAGHSAAAYHCGRLLAELEAIQRAALGYDINATVVDRYFGTASSAPASVFGRLLRGAQPHLSKLHRDKRGLWTIFDERLREITSHIESFPHTLPLREQGLFALGYYHQRTADARESSARKAGKAAVAAGTESDSDSDGDSASDE